MSPARLVGCLALTLLPPPTLRFSPCCPAWDWAHGPSSLSSFLTDSTSLDLESQPVHPAPLATYPAGVAETQEAPEQPDTVRRELHREGCVALGPDPSLTI